MEEHLSLRWNNYEKNMSIGFRHLLLEDRLVDVTLMAEGVNVEAHRLVLSVCSPYFQQLFVNHPKKHPIVILKDVSFKQLTYILNFMYQGEVNVNHEDLDELLKTAHLLQVRGLTEDSQQLHEQMRKSAEISARNKKEIERRNALDKTVNGSNQPVGKKRPVPVAHTSSQSQIVQAQDIIEAGPSEKRVRVEPEPLFSRAHVSLIRKSTPVLLGLVMKEEPPDTQSESDDIQVEMTRTQERVLVHAVDSPLDYIQPEETSPLEPGYEEMPDDLTFVSTCRGQLQLVYQGFRYQVDRRSGTRTFWRCALYRRGCRARCVTIGDRLIRQTQPCHFHPDLQQSGGGGGAPSGQAEELGPSAWEPEPPPNPDTHAEGMPPALQ